MSQPFVIETVQQNGKWIAVLKTEPQPSEENALDELYELIRFEEGPVRGAILDLAKKAANHPL